MGSAEIQGEIWGAGARDWADLQETYSNFEISLPELPKDELRRIGYPLRHRGVSFGERFRMIGFTATDFDDFRKSIGILMRAEDADKAWPLIVKMARVAKVPVEIELEYHEPSPHAGRVIKLWYDPVSDQQGRGWLDN